MTDTEEEFRNAMREVYRRALVEANYDAKLFARMLSEFGPLETAHRLIATSQPSEGFRRLSSVGARSTRSYSRGTGTAP